MSSNTNNLRALIFAYDNHELGESNQQNLDNFIAAVLALLPEKMKAEKTDGTADYWYAYGNNSAIDQTWRNFIGEQPGDSNSPLGESKPLNNQVMPEAPASGKGEQ